MKRLLIAFALVALLGTSAWADIMPSFAGAPAGWVTDRYQPASFSDIGTFQGRNDVLGIGITSAGDLANRAPAYQSTFYNTQGMQHAVAGGAGNDIEADLYIQSSWQVPANGNVRTDMWGVMTDGTPNVTDYPIIGFTNYGGVARYRVWDENTANGWVDLATPVVYDAWTAFSILFTGSTYEYFINGVDVYSDVTTNGSADFSAVIMQAYNFADPSISGAVLQDYNVDWSNSTPEPSSWLLFGTVIFAVGGAIRKRLC